MARRVSWTNNSSGHLGSRVYRAETLDPENLPAPVATVNPVAQGATAEWIDAEELSPGDYEYAVRDYDGSGEGALSGVVTHNIPEDYSTVQIGDYIGGGVYGGTHTDGSDSWHVIFAKQSGELSSGYLWGNNGVSTGATSADDGQANQTEILTNHDDGSADAFYRCRDYIDGDGNSDYYLPARNELALADPLFSESHPEFSVDASEYRWTSTEVSSSYAWGRRPSDGNEKGDLSKGFTPIIVRPVRRVPV